MFDLRTVEQQDSSQSLRTTSHHTSSGLTVFTEETEEKTSFWLSHPSFGFSVSFSRSSATSYRPWLSWGHCSVARPCLPWQPCRAHMQSALSVTRGKNFQENRFLA